METKNNYQYPENLDVISGFGVGSEYELACQKMVVSGMEWLDRHKEANPTFKEYKNVYGLTANENQDMKEMQSFMNKAIDDEASGAMMQACTKHVLYAKKHGWEKYLEEIQKTEEN